jgi:hypothetical protein
MWSKVGLMSAHKFWYLNSSLLQCSSMGRHRGFSCSEACCNLTFCNRTPCIAPNARVPCILGSTYVGLSNNSSNLLILLIVCHSDPGPVLDLPAALGSGHRNPVLQESVEIQAEVGIHPVTAGTENSEAGHREVGMAFLVGGEACLVRPGRVALAFRGRLVVESCPERDRRGEAYRALGAFRACQMEEVGHLERGVS